MFAQVGRQDFLSVGQGDVGKGRERGNGNPEDGPVGARGPHPIQARLAEVDNLYVLDTKRHVVEPHVVHPPQEEEVVGSHGIRVHAKVKGRTGIDD